jgi:hypothetical protein
VTTWAQVLERVRQAVDSTRDELNRLDALAGDGDLGVTMMAASTAAPRSPPAVNSTARRPQRHCASSAWN